VQNNVTLEPQLIMIKPIGLYASRVFLHITLSYFFIQTQAGEMLPTGKTGYPN